MPDYSLINPLCEALDVTVSELLEGQASYNSMNEKQLIDLLRRIQQLENQKFMLYGIIMISMGVSMQALSHVTEPQFISGLRRTNMHTSYIVDYHMLQNLSSSQGVCFYYLL